MIGIVGCGHVGQQVARICRACGARVIAHDIRALDDFCRDADVTPMTLDALLEHADIVSIHVPLDPSTRGMIDARAIARMKRGAFLVNTARGGIVDEQAVKEALVAGRLAGAAFDVFAVEPPVDDELLTLPSFIGTPHIGGATQEAVLAMGRAAIVGLEEGPGSIDVASRP